MAVSSKHTYGQLLSRYRKNRIDSWIKNLPYDWQLDSANTAPLAPAAVYEDWLDWAKPRALSWLARLDKYERRFRIAGVAYHKVPYALRRSTSTCSSKKVEQTVCSRLGQMFEIGRPRSEEPFFHPWDEIFDAAYVVLQKWVLSRGTTPENIDQLRELEAECELTLSQLAKPLRNLEAGLVWVEEQVAKLAERSDLDGTEMLAAKHSREGNMFRMWVQTFLEIEHGVVKSKSAYTEAFVDGAVEDKEIAKDPYWTMLAVAGGEGAKFHSAVCYQAEAAAKKARTGIQELVERADSLLNLCNALEDRYREVGVTFHKTQRAARIAMENSENWSESRYTALEKAFLLESYEEIFAPLVALVKRLTELRTKVQHIPSSTEAHHLLFALEFTLLPRMNVLVSEYETFSNKLCNLEQDVYQLDVFNRQHFQVNELGERCAWYDPVLDIANSKRTVRSRDGEYVLFADWVYSLPEARRALGVQIEIDGLYASCTLFADRLFVYSVDLIWHANEGVVVGGAE
ncbi:hypothetical protein BKA58DRAFT_462849 [Alternaria rosae]|uniref:uncharacterized protein n=1 Tax=Alternaria rosae TaxID=1187941 RepID=UPI001E8E8E3E|nr:uncharacterized protein BKA58DRAFT_462849 [Alternaria rosae]KAH6865200.1 hypothetical protein BKA58DRAFT_462849 [Alternaria rosae]